MIHIINVSMGIKYLTSFYKEPHLKAISLIIESQKN